MSQSTPIFIPGLVSISFRNLSPKRIVLLVKDGGLKSIEWGADVHAPPGDLNTASRIRKICDDDGIAISAYGSYYRAGVSGENGADFSILIKTARELGADSIRVWAGNLGSEVATNDVRQAVVADLKRICGMAGEVGCRVSLEFHGGTLTDSAEATNRLIAEVAAANLTTYWQPPVGMGKEDCLAGLRIVRPYLQNLHVFHWWPNAEHRLPLADGTERWREYLKLVGASGKPRHASLEFVRGDDPAQFREDARTFLDLLDTGIEV